MQRGVIKFDFVAQGENELSVNRGTTVLIVPNDNGEDDGWCFCKLAKNPKVCGFIPSDFVAILRRRTKQAKAALAVKKPELNTKRLKEIVESERLKQQKIESKKLRQQQQTNANAQRIKRLRVSVGNRLTKKPVTKRVSHRIMQSLKIKDKVPATGTNNNHKGSPTGPGGIPKPQEPKKEIKIAKIDVSNPDNIEALKIIGGKIKDFINYRRVVMFATPKVNKETKGPRKRLNNIHETIKTEETYYMQLSFCIDEIMVPIKRQRILTPQEMKALFADIESLRDISKRLIEDLNDIMKSFPNGVNIGRAFKSISPFFKLYKTYINNYDSSITCLDKFRKRNANLAKFLENVHKRSPPYAKNYGLNDYLILPIQRIPRYKMLLQNILDATPLDNSDYKNTEESLKIVSEVAMFINTAKKEQQKTSISIELSKALKGRYDTLIQSHRKFIGETKLKVYLKQKGDKRFHQHSMYLFSDLLIFLQNEKLMIPKNQKTYIIFLACSKIVDSSQFSSSKMKDNGKQTYLQSVSDGKLVNIIIQFNTSTEKDKWTPMISQEITKTMQKNQRKLGNIDFLNLAIQRIEENRQKKQKEKDLKTKELRVQKNEEELKKINKTITEYEKKMMKYASNITNKQLEKHKNKTELDSIEKKGAGIREIVSAMYKKLNVCDKNILTSLGNENDAFFEIFGNKPVSENLIPKPLTGKK